MEGCGMKYESDIFLANALPDAPLAMPKQRLERRRTLLSAFRDALVSLSWL
jgi:hypothetical protein